MTLFAYWPDGSVTEVLSPELFDELLADAPGCCVLVEAESAEAAAYEVETAQFLRARSR